MEHPTKCTALCTRDLVAFNVQYSRFHKTFVARMNCWYDTNKTQSGKEKRAFTSHFDDKSFNKITELCVGAQVALRKWNILPCAGLYNGSIGTVVEIVYKNRPIGPNDKQHNHLPDYVVVDFPNLKLPHYVEPWDKLHPTVKEKQMCHIVYLTISVHNLSDN